MKHMLGNGFLSIVLSMLVSLWFFGDKITETFVLSLSGEDIQSLDAKFNNRKIYLNVHLKNDTTCEKITEYLGVESVTIKDKRYAPSCEKINNKLIIITYDEIMDV